MKFLQILFSIYVWTICFLWMAILAIVTILLLPAVPYKKSHSRVAAPGFAACFRLAFSRIRVTYDPAFDPERRSVFCQNHINLLDAHAASAAIPHAFCGLMNAWQFHIPFYGWLMRLSKGIPVHGGDPRKTLEEITQAAKERMAMGFSILVFPEAHRTPDGKVHRFRRGVFLMARDAGYPVVPVAVRGLRDINQKGSLLFKPGKIEVYVGPQMETAGLSDAEIETLAQKTRDIVARFAD